MVLWDDVGVEYLDDLRCFWQHVELCGCSEFIDVYLRCSQSFEVSKTPLALQEFHECRGPLPMTLAETYRVSRKTVVWSSHASSIIGIVRPPVRYLVLAWTRCAPTLPTMRLDDGRQRLGSPIWLAVQKVGRSQWLYDPQGRLTDLTHFNALDAVLVDFDYQYDAAYQLIRESGDSRYDPVHV